MTEQELVLRVQDLKLWFDNDFGSTQILNGIDFNIYKGETLGIVGESGCGKSMTSFSIMRLLRTPPARIKGDIRFKDENLLKLSEKKMRKIRGKSISMIFQEPMTSLNPLFTIGDQMCETYMLHQGLSRKEAEQKAIEMLNEVKESIINAYQLKTGISRAKISHLMDSETWMNAYKAVELGFADDILFRNDEKEDEEEKETVLDFGKEDEEEEVEETEDTPEEETEETTPETEEEDDEEEKKKKPSQSTENRMGAMMFSRKHSDNALMSKISKHYRKKDTTPAKGKSVNELMERLNLMKR